MNYSGSYAIAKASLKRTNPFTITNTSLYQLIKNSLDGFQLYRCVCVVLNTGIPVNEWRFDRFVRAQNAPFTLIYMRFCIAQPHCPMWSISIWIVQFVEMCLNCVREKPYNYNLNSNFELLVYLRLRFVYEGNKGWINKFIIDFPFVSFSTHLICTPFRFVCLFDAAAAVVLLSSQFSFICQMVCNLYTVFSVVLAQKVHLSIAPFVLCRVCVSMYCCCCCNFSSEMEKTETIQFQMRKIRNKEMKKKKKT